VELLSEALPGKKQAVAFPVALLFVGRERCAGGFSPLRHFFLLLFYGFALPAACHLRNITSKFRGGLKKLLACALGTG